MTGSPVLSSSSWSYLKVEMLRQLKSTGPGRWEPHRWPGEQKVNMSVLVENMMDRMFPSFVWLVRQEGMSLIDMSAISLAPTLARCLSSVQNGAERGRGAHAGWKHQMCEYWVMVQNVPPGKQRTGRTGILGLSYILSRGPQERWWASENPLNI